MYSGFVPDINKSDARFEVNSKTSEDFVLEKPATQAENPEYFQYVVQSLPILLGLENVEKTLLGYILTGALWTERDLVIAASAVDKFEIDATGMKRIKPSRILGLANIRLHQ